MPRARLTTFGVYGACLVAAGGLYALSCAPGTLWQDSGLIQHRLGHGDIRGFLGLALSHPLFYIVARAGTWLPIGEFSHRVNLVSAWAGAITVANVGLLIYVWAGRVFPAVIGALALALAHTFWWHASVAETYTLWAALFTGELLALLQYDKTRQIRYLYLLGLLNGMALAVHMLACLPCLCYVTLVIGLWVKRRIRPIDMLVVAMLWAVGALPYGYLVVERMIESGQIVGTLASAAFGDRWQSDVLNVRLSWKLLTENVQYAVLNCPSPNMLLFGVGTAALWRMKETRIFRGVLPALMTLFFLFAFRYTVVDRYAFFIPFYITASICIGFGASVVQERLKRKWPLVLIGCCALLPAGVYAALPEVARRTQSSIGTRADVAYRDDYAYFLQPWKTGYRGADRFAEETLQSVQRDAVIYADSTTVGPLLYAQDVHGRRGDVKIVTGIVSSEGAPAYGAETFRRLVWERPIYVTSNRAGYCPRFVLEGPYELARAGLLWRVVSTAATRPN